MLMIPILSRCNKIQLKQPCCHSDGRECNCINCLKDGFYSKDQDTYGCLKRLCFYTMNYGPMYVSEIYHFLNKAKLLEDVVASFQKVDINIISIGCVFGPDYIASLKYCSDYNPDIHISYTGFDIEQNWKKITNGIMNNVPITYDIFKGFSLSDFHIIFLNKLFSTLKQNNQSNDFLRILIEECKNSMPHGSFLVFNDINHRDKGRDEFDRAISNVLNPVAKYYFNIRDAYTDDYIEIPDTHNICQIPSGLPITPLRTATKSVFFLYQKQA